MAPLLAAFILLYQPFPNFQFFGPRTDAGCVILRTEDGVTLYRFGSRRSTIPMRNEKLREAGWTCTAFRSETRVRLDCMKDGRQRRAEVRCGTDHPVTRTHLSGQIRVALFCQCSDRREGHQD